MNLFARDYVNFLSHRHPLYLLLLLSFYYRQMPIYQFRLFYSPFYYVERICWVGLETVGKDVWNNYLITCFWLWGELGIVVGSLQLPYASTGWQIIDFSWVSMPWSRRKFSQSILDWFNSEKSRHMWSLQRATGFQSIQLMTMMGCFCSFIIINALGQAIDSFPLNSFVMWGYLSDDVEVSF